MSTFNQMVSEVQSLVGNHSSANSTVVGGFVNSTHDELLQGHEWSRKKSEAFLAGTPDKTAGTVTLTSGLATVVGVDTSWAATDTGKYMLIADSLYVFTHVGAMSGTLADYRSAALAYPGDTASLLNYVLFKRWYSLGTGIGSILTMGHQNDIKERDQEFLDAHDSSRSTVGTTNPIYFARGPRSSADTVQIEFWPRLSTGIVVNANVLKSHVDMSGSDNPIVPSTAIKWPAAEKTCYHLFAKNKEPKWLALADKYNKMGMTALTEAKNQDAKQFGRSPAVKDVGGGNGLIGTDFALTHDLGV